MMTISRLFTTSILALSVCLATHLVVPPVASAKDPSQASKALLVNSGSSVADVAESVAPSVVNIDVEKTRPGMNGDFSFPFGDDVFRRFFGFDPSQGSPFQPLPKRPGGIQKTITSNGSGVVWDKNGHILTNNHVVQGADKITVTFCDGKTYTATLQGHDPYSDLAILKLDASSNLTQLKPARLGISQALRPGDFVLAIGSPLGFDHTVTLGIISAKSRKVPDINHNVEFLQTDAAINPGNSGGPLVNLKGEVIGINTAISGIGQNIGFAIPVDTVKAIAQSLIVDGQIKRPWIGIAMADLNPDLAKRLGLSENTTGVAVSQVMAGSPADKAGFKPEDIIQRINGQKIQTAKEIQQLVQTQPLNTKMELQILRGGKTQTLKLATEQLPQTLSKNATPAKQYTPPGPAMAKPMAPNGVFGQEEDE